MYEFLNQILTIIYNRKGNDIEKKREKKGGHIVKGMYHEGDNIVAGIIGL